MKLIQHVKGCLPKSVSINFAPDYCFNHQAPIAMGTIPFKPVGPISFLELSHRALPQVRTLSLLCTWAGDEIWEDRRQMVRCAAVKSPNSGIDS